MFSPQYQALLRHQALLQRNNPQQPATRLGGFGTFFKDTPPAFISETKVDNKIGESTHPENLGESTHPENPEEENDPKREW